GGCGVDSKITPRAVRRPTCSPGARSGRPSIMTPARFQAKTKRPQPGTSSTDVWADKRSSGGARPPGGMLSSTMALLRALAHTPLIVGSLVGLFGLNCGPSYSVMYANDAEWERCNALDRDPGTPNEARLQCWQGWQQIYTPGVHPERIQHAQ